MAGPTAAAGANAGTGAPNPAVQADARDDAFHIWAGTGTGPTAGVLLTVTLAANYSSAVDMPATPRLSMVPLNANAAALGLSATIAARVITVSCTGTPGAGLPAGPSGIGIMFKIDF